LFTHRPDASSITTLVVVGSVIALADL